VRVTLAKADGGDPGVEMRSGNGGGRVPVKTVNGDIELVRLAK